MYTSKDAQSELGFKLLTMLLEPILRAMSQINYSIVISFEIWQILTKILMDYQNMTYDA